MAWNDEPDYLRHTAERILTKKQLETMKLRSAGMSHRQIAHRDGVALSTITNRIRRAEQKIMLALQQETAA